MPKPISDPTRTDCCQNNSSDAPDPNTRPSALSELVSRHLQIEGLRQVDFCRRTGFDQGLLSKILSSVVTTLNVETALKLAEGLGLPPGIVLETIGKKDVDELLRKFYQNCERVM